MRCCFVSSPNLCSFYTFGINFVDLFKLHTIFNDDNNNQTTTLFLFFYWLLIITFLSIAVWVNRRHIFQKFNDWIIMAINIQRSKTLIKFEENKYVEQMCLTFACLLPPQKGATAVQQECALKRLCFTMMSKESERSRQNFRSALHFTPPCLW